MTTPIGDIFIGAVRIPLSAAFELSQTYGPIGGFILLRTLNGSAIKQQNWQKISTSISGSGAIPVGLDEIDFKLSQVLRCGASKGVTSSSRTVHNDDSPCPRERKVRHQLQFFQHPVVGNQNLVLGQVGDRSKLSLC